MKIDHNNTIFNYMKKCISRALHIFFHKLLNRNSLYSFFLFKKNNRINYLVVGSGFYEIHPHISIVSFIVRIKKKLRKLQH